MKNFKKIAIAAAVLSAMTSIGAHAQSSSYNPSWYLAPSVTALDPDNKFGVDKRGTGGALRLGMPLNPSWDIQFGPSSARSSVNGNKYTQTLLGLDGLYMFSREQFRPFLLVGASAERDRATVLGITKTRTSPSLSAGLGFQYGFTDQVALQLDVRRVVGLLRSNSFGTNGNRSNNNYLGLGLNFAFDKPAAPLPPPKPVTPVAPPPPQPVAPLVQPQPPATPPPPPAPKFERITLSATELFAFDRAELKLPQPKLDEMATMLNNYPQIKNVTINGFTDRLGSDAYNKRLSQRRADAVRNYLAGKGVDKSRITAIGKGKANPVAECKETKQTKRPALIKCLEPNRRVEVEQISAERRVN